MIVKSPFLFGMINVYKLFYISAESVFLDI